MWQAGFLHAPETLLSQGKGKLEQNQMSSLKALFSGWL